MYGQCEGAITKYMDAYRLGNKKIRVHPFNPCSNNDLRGKKRKEFSYLPCLSMLKKSL